MVSSNKKIKRYTISSSLIIHFLQYQNIFSHFILAHEEGRKIKRV